jgi:predicted nucleotidyltransferase
MTSKIDKLFGSKTRVTILSEFLLNPDKSYYLRELSRKLKIPYSMLYKEVKNLVDIGILKQEKKGKVTLLKVNKELPYFHELRVLFIKTAALGEVIKTTLMKFRGIKYALIYGSFASGEADERSDVDLLIIGSVREEKLAEEISRIERKIDREINYILWKEKEFLNRARQKHHLLNEIANSFIMLIGDENEFRRAIER